jgi:SAM-dependent methyltransferase
MGLKPLKQYWNEAYVNSYSQPDSAEWLDKYISQLEEARGGRILDLGCGIGNNCLYLHEKGYKPVACDISEEALVRAEQFIPGLETRCFDLAEGIPFENASVQVIVADLSLHYFTDLVTFGIVEDIRRVLAPGGLLLCRLNSTKELAHKPEAVALAAYLYESHGILRRLFDSGEIDRFFVEAQWERLHKEEQELTRYGSTKVLWELALKKRS